MTTTHDSPLPPLPPMVRRLIVVCAAVATVLAMTSLLGWLLGNEALKAVVPGFRTMKANTAISIILVAAALLTRLSASAVVVRIGIACALLAAAITALTLLQYLTGSDLFIDQLLFPATDEQGRTIPGRMAPLTALSILIIALATAQSLRTAAWSDRVAVVVPLIALITPALAVVGYAYGVAELYAPTPLWSMAVYSAIGLTFLSIGVSLTRPDIGWVALMRSSGPGGLIARALLPGAILLPLVIGWLALQGEIADFYALHSGFSLLALACAVILGLLVWWAAARVDRLDEARRRQIELNRTVIDAALDAFVLMDGNGRILHWNPQAEQIFGWKRDEVLGRTVAETIIPPAQRTMHAEGLKRAAASGEGKILNRRNKLRAIRRDGSEFPVELVVAPIRFDKQFLFSGFVRDLTDQEQAEAQLRQAQKMEAVGQLTGGIAHDFNNLLTVIIGSLDTYLADTRKDKSKEPVEMALEAGERGAKLVEQLLAISRRQALRVGLADLNQMCKGMDALLRRALGEDIEIDLRLAGDAWLALADEGRVKDALLNLAVNARDAMPNGGKLTIETSNVTLDETYAHRNEEVAAGDYVVLAVTDTGIGMAPDVIERAFEPFFTTKEVGKGSGLGLSMVYGFAKQSRGHLKIYSEVGHGTTVRLYLPRAQPAPQTATIEPPSAIPTGGESILYVEDDPAVRALVVSQLSGLGYRVLNAADGPKAKVLLSGDEKIDLLFTDVVMPGGMTGRQLATEAKRLRPGLRVLYTSGYTENSIVHQGRLDPDVHFLPKPYRHADLAKKVRAALDAPA